MPVSGITDLNNYLDRTLNENYTDPEFRAILENYIEYFKYTLMQNPRDANIIDITPVDAAKYRYDFYGLMNYKNIPFPMHWITLRVNGYRNPYDDFKDLRTVMVPAKASIDNILKFHLNAKKK